MQTADVCSLESLLKATHAETGNWSILPNMVAIMEFVYRYERHNDADVAQSNDSFRVS